MEYVDSIRLGVIGTAGGDSDGRLGIVGKHDNTIAGGVGFWLLGENLGDGEKIPGVRRPFALT